MNFNQISRTRMKSRAERWRVRRGPQRSLRSAFQSFAPAGWGIPAPRPLSLTHLGDPTPGTHKGPSAPDPAPCHYISPGPLAPPSRSPCHRLVVGRRPSRCSGTGWCGWAVGPLWVPGSTKRRLMHRPKKCQGESAPRQGALSRGQIMARAVHRPRPPKPTSMSAGICESSSSRHCRGAI